MKALEDVSGLAEHELPTYRDQFEKDVEAVLDAVGYGLAVARAESGQEALANARAEIESLRENLDAVT